MTLSIFSMSVNAFSAVSLNLNFDISTGKESDLSDESEPNIDWANADPPIDVYECEDGSTGFSRRY